MPQPAAPAVALAWSWSLRQSPTASPVILGDVVLVPTQADDPLLQQAPLHALRLQDGMPAWQQAFERGVISGLAVTSDLALVALTSTDLLYGEGCVVAVDAAGAVHWRWAPGVQQLSAPAVTDDLVCVTADANRFVLLDCRTGEEKRHYDSVGSVASLEAPCPAGDCWLVPCRAPSLLALEQSGELRWRFVVEGGADGWLDRTPAVAGERCFTVLSTGVAFGLRLADGKVLWKADVGPSGKRLSAPATDGERLYLGAQEGLHALDCETGEAWWHFPTSRRVEAAPVVAGGVVYTACHDHYLYALEASTGKEIWRFEGERRLPYPPLLTECGDPHCPCVVGVDREGAVVAVTHPLSVQDLEAAGEWVKAAATYAEIGMAARGAALLETHDEPFKAAELWKVAGKLERAASLYEQSADWKRSAELWATLGRPLRQAQALEHWAATLEGHPVQERAELWSKAADLYAGEGEDRSAETCRREVARCLQQPLIVMEVQHERLVEGTWSVLQFVMRNDGYGTARNLVIHATGDEFEGQIACTRQITNLAPGKTREEPLDIRPLEHGRVPLRLHIEYLDRSGTLHTVPHTLYIPVADKKAVEFPSILKIQTTGGAVVLGDTLKEGDFVGRDHISYDMATGLPGVAGATATEPFAGSCFADLEIRISERQGAGYPVEITLNDELEFPRGYLAGDIFPWVSSGDLVADGERLFEALVTDVRLRDAWAEARGQSQRRRRIRLRVESGAPELHLLPWELLREKGRMIAANSETPFSRYLSLPDPWGEAVAQRPIRVLAVISNPQDLQSDYDLTPVDVAQERKLLENAFATLGAERITLDFLEAPVTLERLEEKLRGGYHILHYVGHGAFSARRGEAVLYLQDDKGNTALAADAVLSGMVGRQGVRPRLIFLAACQSATRSTADAFLGLGPQLVASGVPAVVAMQDFVAVKSARKFSAAFYRRLSVHGTVDLAMNEARSGLVTAGRADAAVPVLFMRLKSGKLWDTVS